MQHTGKYQLNLIERADTFSPDALNENTRKVEDALAKEEKARKESDACLTGRADGLDVRVAALEAHKIAIGTYKGEVESTTYNVWQTVSLDFTPIAVFVQATITILPSLATRSAPNPILEIVENGFRVRNQSGSYLNDKAYKYMFIALA